MDDATSVPKVYQRKWIERDNEQSRSPPDFSVLTYNLLADKHIPNDKYLYCPPEIRYMKWRHKHILAEIDEYGGDIVCLQEVSPENFENNMKPALETRGFCGDIVLRRFGSGQATFFKSSKFELMDVKKVAFPDVIMEHIQDLNLEAEERDAIKHQIECAGGCVLLTALKHKASGKLLYVANIHLLWGALQYPGIQTTEVVLASKELLKFAGGTDRHVIFCGDFNSPPDWPPYILLNTGKVDSTMEVLRKETPSKAGVNMRIIDPTVEVLKKETPPIAESDRTITDYLYEIFKIPFNFRSSYMTVQGKEPVVTNCDDGWQDFRTWLCLDYIWFNHGKLDVTGVLQTPPEEDISKYHALPSRLFPSDHIPLKADFRFI